MSDVSKTIDQQEATVEAVLYASPHINEETRRDIAEGWVRLRSQLNIDSGLPPDSPLRDGSEPETAALKKEEAAPAKAAAKK